MPVPSIEVGTYLRSAGALQHGLNAYKKITVVLTPGDPAEIITEAQDPERLSPPRGTDGEILWGDSMIEIDSNLTDDKWEAFIQRWRETHQCACCGEVHADPPRRDS